MSGEHVTNAEDVIQAEREHIGEMRGFGLAISGGGIRSASFGLGVLQALVRRGVLEAFDYMSTVSGGGYIGSSLTWWLKEGLPGGDAAGTSSANFPLGAPGMGSKANGNRNVILDYIRQHGNYLIPGHGLNLTSLIAIALRSIFVSLFVYLSLATVVMAGLSRLGAFRDVSLSAGHELVPILWLAALLAALFIIASLVFSVRSLLARGRKGQRYAWAVLGQRVMGWLLALFIAAVAIGSLKYVGHAARQLAVAGVSTLVGLAAGLFQFVRSQVPRSPGAGSTPLRRLVAAATPVVGALALIYGILLAAYLLAARFTDPLWFGGLFAVALFFGACVNLNYVGFHRMYRDRLMETFLPDIATVEGEEWSPAKKADWALLEDMCEKDRPRPYHLINANAVLGGSSNPKLSGRGGDAFLLSPLFCGSDATGWCPTASYMKGVRSRGLTLATAMAISGAAVSPDAGVAGGGATRNRLVSALMSLLNLRLGYWAPNPNPRRRRFWPLPPTFLVPGVTGGIFGRGLDEDAVMITLTDGGHFENLGLYELIRRKVRVIVVCDAAADPRFRFGDLANAVERVRVDFGTTIRFQKDLDLQGLTPGSAAGGLADKLEFAERGFAVATIYYSDCTTGQLIYLKSTLTAELPADIYGYKSAHPSFPDQSTADQFFDEAQFEAYRELGYQLAMKMMDSEAGGGLLPLGEKTDPCSGASARR